MTEDQSMTEFDEADTQTEQNKGGDLADLRKAANRAKSLERELAEAQRQLAFTQAGIDTTDERLGYFVRGYTGETTPEAIKEAATKAGFLAAPAPDPKEQQAQQAQQRIEGATGGTPGYVPDQSQRLVEAARTGGNDAVLAQLREAGIPISTDSY